MNMLIVLFAILACAGSLNLRIDSGSITNAKTQQPDTGFLLGDMLQENALEFGYGQIIIDPLLHSGDTHGRLVSLANAVANGVGARVRSNPYGNNISANMSWRASSIMTALKSGAVRMEGGIVTLNYWTGRFGNHLNQLGAALVFARYVGASQLNIAKTTYPDRAMLNLPRSIPLPGMADQSLLNTCKGVDAAGAAAGTFNWWRVKCERVPAHIWHEELTRHLLPHLSEASQQCINDGATDEKERTLTVHVRVGDVPDTTFPCSLPPKIYEAGRYEKMVIVKDEANHTCVTSYTTSKYKEWRIQDTCCNDMATDFCRLMKAKALFVGHSTFSEMAALMSNRVRHLYHGGDDWEPHPYHPGVKGIDWCTNDDNRLWPKGPILQQFDYPGYNAGDQLSFSEDNIIRKDNAKCVM